MVIGESHWWYQKFPEIWKRWLTQSLDCVSERFANVWLDDELDYHAGLWSYATGPQPVEHQNQYEMYLKEELFEVLFGKLATMCTPITCYDLRNCYQMVVGNHFNTNRNRWNDFRITYYLKANSTHSQNLSLMSVSPPKKKQLCINKFCTSWVFMLSGIFDIEPKSLYCSCIFWPFNRPWIPPEKNCP